MSKKFTTFLLAATMLGALSAQAQVTRQPLKKTATSAQEAIISPRALKGEHKKLTAQELAAAKQAGDKQALQKQESSKRKPQKGLSKAPRKVEASEATPVTVPYEADFAEGIDAFENDFIVINNNDDLSDFEPCTWNWSGSSGAYYVYNQDGVTGADDYLVLPVILEGGKTYEVTVNAATWNYPEEFEVVAGTECTASALTTTIIGKMSPEDEPADYSGTFTPAADGVYYVAIHCTSEPDQYILSIYRFSIDVQASPEAPAAVDDLTVTTTVGELKTTLSFTAPTLSIGGDALTGDVTIEVLRNGELVKTIENVAPGSTQTYTDEVPAEGAYVYKLVTYNAAGKGRTSKEQKVTVMLPKDLPYFVSFDETDAFYKFQVIDNNDDGSTWEDNPSSNVAQYRYNWDNTADDYLVTQPLNLQAGRKYVVTINAACFNSDYVERFDVVAGKNATAEDLNISVIESTEVSSEAFTEYSGSFTADESGVYYVAIHATSAPNQYYLMVSSISVETSAEPTAPAAPTLTATAAAMGELKATIEVTAPDKTVEGGALASITKMELYRGNDLVAEKSDVAPGSTITFTDEGIETSALYSYNAVAYNESGRGEKSEKADVYVGIDQPEAPTEVTAVDHGGTVDFSWNAVGETGLNGGYVIPSEVTYDICSLFVSPYFVAFGDVLGSVKGQTSVTVEYNTDEGDEQDYNYFAVRATNEATEDVDNAAWDYTALFTGKPYDSVVEGFAEGELHYFWDTNALLMISNYSADNDGSALALISEEAGLKTMVSGKLNLKDAADPKLVFAALGNNISKLHVLGSVDGKGNWSLLQTFDLTGDYQTYQLSLASLKNHERYAQIAFAAEFVNTCVLSDDEIVSTGDYFFLDNIRIGDILDNDLAIGASAPASITAGQTANIIVYVENKGTKAAKDYKVIVKAGEKELFSETVAEELSAFSLAQFATQMPTTVFDEAGDVNVTISVEYEADQNTENNTIAGYITVDEPTAAAPLDLTAENNDAGGADLSWTAPDTQAEDVTEDFENGPGEFTQIDGNLDGFGWDYIYDEEYGELNAHSGYGGMQSYSWLPGGMGAVHVDNWIVTPLAILDGTFSFWAAAQDGDWTDEHFAVYVSTTGNQSADDFTQVSEEFVASGWSQEYTVDLSGYAGQEGYIAIRHFNSYDNFALVVDDISFTKAPALPVEYNVYADEQLIATVVGETTTYTVDADLLTEGEHTFAVTAVYANGMESLPTTATINVVSGISQLVADGQPVDIYTVDGRMVRRQATSTDGLRGVYVVRYGKDARTVIVK